MRPLRRAIADLTRQSAGRDFLYQRLMVQDEMLVAKGFPPISEWWRATIRDFYSSGKRWLVARVGRRGGKSSTLCRLAVVEALWGDHSVPPGDVGYFVFVSVSMKEASERLVTIRQILDAIGEQYTPIDGGIRLLGTNRGFRVYPATISGVSGFTSIGFVCDEMSKWKDKDSGANPSREVVSSLKPTLATQRNAKGIYSSSPLSTLDLHYELFELGNTDTQVTAYAPTWIANPTVTEEWTHQDEPDGEVWSREYLGKPMGAGEHSFLDPFAVDRCVRADLAMPLQIPIGARRVAGGDFAFERNASALAVSFSLGVEADQTWTLADLRELKPEPGVPLLPSDVIGQFAGVLRSHSVPSLVADQHYRMAVVEYLTQHGLLYFDAPTGQKGKAESFVRLRVLINQGRLIIPGEPHELVARLVNQLKRIRYRPTASGGMSILQDEDASGRHGDMVSALVLSVLQREGEVVALRPPEPAPYTPEWYAAEDAKRKKKLIDDQAARNLAAFRRMTRRR